MLLQLRDYMLRERVASTQQLAREFRIDEDTLQPMLDVWVRKGIIEPCEQKLSCQSTCARCKIKKTAFYQIRV